LAIEGANQRMGRSGSNGVMLQQYYLMQSNSREDEKDTYAPEVFSQMAR
jgi:hypothetical protein